MRRGFLVGPRFVGTVLIERDAQGMNEQTWQQLKSTYAFLGNSLLAPMSQTDTFGLDPRFWEEMPSFEDADLSRYLDDLAKFASAVQEGSASLEDVVTNLSVEWTHLFIGPPEPTCSPWETYYRREGVRSGFGAATFEMRDVFRKLGYGAAGQNNQFEDHVGFELLAMSLLCQAASRVSPDSADLSEEVRALRAEQGLDERVVSAAYVLEVLRQHPAWWVGRLAQTVAEESPGGYYALLLAYAARLLAWHEERLAEELR